MRKKIYPGAIVTACALVGMAVGTGAPAEAASSKPVYGGNPTIARAADSESMNNTNVFDNESIWVFEQMFQTLYTVNPNGKGVMPELATGYSISPNKLVYTFNLRPGVKFSTGKPMTSASPVRCSPRNGRRPSAGGSRWSSRTPTRRSTPG